MTLTFPFNGQLVEFHDDAFYVPPVYIAISDGETEQLLRQIKNPVSLEFCIRSMFRRGMDYSAFLPGGENSRTTHCWNCKFKLNTLLDEDCETCGGLTCLDCFSCFCNCTIPRYRFARGRK